MTKTTIKIEGMMCGMCVAHVNDAVRAAFNPKKVTSSHAKCETVIISEGEIDEAKLKDVVKEAGYTPGEVTSEPYKKKGLFSFGK